MSIEIHPCLANPGVNVMRTDELALNRQAGDFLQGIQHAQLIAELERVDECRPVMPDPCALQADMLRAKVAMTIPDTARSRPRRQGFPLPVDACLKECTDLLKLS